MDISDTDMRILLRAISVLRPSPEQSIHELNAIRKLKLFYKKQLRRKNGKQDKICKPLINYNRKWQN